MGARRLVGSLVVSALVLLVGAPSQPGSAQVGPRVPLDLSLGAYGGMVELGSGSGRFPNVGAVVQSGAPEGLQLRLGIQAGLMGEATLVQLETLLLLNLRFGARLHLGGGLGVNWLSGAAPDVRLPLVAVAALKRPIGPLTLFLEGAAYYGFLADEWLGLRWSLGALFSL